MPSDSLTNFGLIFDDSVESHDGLITFSSNFEILMMYCGINEAERTIIQHLNMHEMHKSSTVKSWDSFYIRSLDRKLALLP